MNVNKLKILVLIMASSLYWQIARHLADVPEPWDALNYWYIWYPCSLIVSGISGYWLKSQGWSAGLIITYAQLPVIWYYSESFALAPVSILYLGVLAIPATALSYFAGRIANFDQAG